MSEKRSGEAALSLISTNTAVEGKISTEGSIRIDGKVVGDLIAKANAAVGPTGVIEGSITARNIALSGRVKGTISAAEKLILESKSVVRGDIRALRLVVDEGAIFDGHCTMPKTDGEPTRPGGHPAV